MPTMLATMAKEIRERGEYRFGRWGSFGHRFAVARWRWAVALCKFDDHWALHLLCLWVTLWRSRSAPHEMLDSWGFTFDPFGDSGPPSLHLSWGRHVKVLWLPWSREWVRTEHGMPDGSFVTVECASHLPRWLGGRRYHLNESGRLEKVVPWRPGQPVRSRADLPGRYRQSFPYRYRLRSGEAQVRTATVTTMRMTHAYRLPYLFGIFWPCRSRTSIEVEFSDEVGEKTGSWKGGCIGCGYDMKPGETPEQCLRRMEAGRKF